jgi:dTDP-4-amino-4,6-dideoxygalactose transaminase
MAHLANAGIGTLVHYPVPIPRQAAFSQYTADCPVADRVAREVLSLPLHPRLGDDDVRLVAATLRAWRPEVLAADVPR